MSLSTPPTRQEIPPQNNGNPLMTAVGLAVLDAVLAPGFLDGVVARGAELARGLAEISRRRGLGEVRGRGLLVALDLGRDVGAKVAEHARANGLLLNSPRPNTLRFMPALGLAVKTLLAMSQDCNLHTLTLLQWLGRSETSWPINAELGDLSALAKPSEPLFSLWRWDARLEADWLQQRLERSFDQKTLERLRRMDVAENAELAYEVGQRAAAEQVTPESVRRLLA